MRDVRDARYDTQMSTLGRRSAHTRTRHQSRSLERAARREIP
jgi:hypothetical protein